MASKLRPKGSYKDLLNLSSNDFKNLTEGEIKAIVNKLNDAANKRLKRVYSSGYDALSSAYRTREGKKFTSLKMPSLEGLDESQTKQVLDEYRSDLRTSYLDVKSFLEMKTSSLYGTKKYVKGFDTSYESILGKPLDDPSNYDKRFKEKVLKKSVKNKIRDFWDKYEQWKEIEKNKNPDSAVGDTNINDVEEFEEELYDNGKVTISDMEKKAEEDYLKAEREQQEEDLNEYEDTNPIQPPKPKRRGKARTKRNKYKGKGKQETWQPKVSFESISIFGDDD